MGNKRAERVGLVLSAFLKLGFISESDYMKRKYRLKVRLAVDAAPPISDAVVQDLRRLFRTPPVHLV